MMDFDLSSAREAWARISSWWSPPRLWAAVFSAAAIALACWQDPTDPPLVLAATLAAVIWYTAFAYEQIKASRLSAEATRELADLRLTEARRGLTRDLGTLLEELGEMHIQAQKFSEGGPHHTRLESGSLPPEGVHFVPPDALERANEIIQGIHDPLRTPLLVSLTVIREAERLVTEARSMVEMGVDKEGMIKKLRFQTHTSYWYLRAAMVIVEEQRKPGNLFGSMHDAD